MAEEGEERYQGLRPASHGMVLASEEGRLVGHIRLGSEMKEVLIEQSIPAHCAREVDPEELCIGMASCLRMVCCRIRKVWIYHSISRMDLLL